MTAKITAAGRPRGRVRQPRPRVVTRRRPRLRRRRAATGSTTSSRISIATDDFGATWTSIAGNLPNEPINVVFEDREEPGPAVRRQRHRRVRVDRSRRALGEDEQQHAEHRRCTICSCTRARTIWCSAPYGRGLLDHQHRRAAGADRRRAREGRAPVRDQADRAARHLVVRRERLPVRPAAPLRRRTSRTAW